LLISRASRNLPSPLSAGLFFFAALVFVAAPVPSGRAQATQAQSTQTHVTQAQAGQTSQSSDLDELGGLSAAAMTNDSGPAGIIPVAKGFNVSLGTTSQHDSSSGWSSLLTPNVAYRLDRYFSMDAGVSMYMYINIDANVGTKTKPVYVYSAKNEVFGDTSLSFHGDASFLSIDYNGIVSMGLPSGNTDYGLGAGQVTYNINNHFEKNFDLFTPDIEFGFGDTSTLVNQRVVKNYVAVGPMAHFQAGTSVDLPWRTSFEADAYEELPLDKNLVYSTTGKGKKKVTTSTNLDPGEDNGFITSLDIPLNPHVTMSGFYSRSLRDHEDTGGFSFTFLLKAPPRPPEVAF
jgi:hypothetical protein